MQKPGSPRIIKSPYTIDIPPIDVATFVFSSGTASSRQKPQYFDATSPSKCYSLAQAEGFVKRVGLGFQRLGLKPDDKVLLYSNNRLFFPVLLWGTIAAGCVFTAASPSASASELEYQLRDSEARTLITSPDTASIALKAATKAGLPRDRVYLFCDPEEDLKRHASLQLRPWTDIWASVEESSSWSWRKITTLEDAMSTTAVLNYSSGTTGLPKGVEISHYNLVANAEQVVFKRNIVGNTPEGRARKARVDASGERWLAPLPMYHAYGQTYYCINAPLIGAKVFIMPKFTIDTYLLYLDIYHVTTLTAVPTIMVMLTKQSHPERYNLHAVETAGCGSAPLNGDIGRLVEKMYFRPGVHVKQGWGMTECTCSVAGFAPDDVDDGSSVGLLNPNCWAKIVPVEDRDFKSGTGSAESDGEVVGELWVSGPNVMKGYYKKPEATADTIVYEDGVRWLRTGDVAYIDKRERIYIVDRLKELIKVKGLQVSPTELELALLTHPSVADAAVTSAKINGNEYPRGFIVQKKGAPAVTEQELADMIKRNFAPHKWLTGGVYFIDAIPRTGSGKVMRRALPNPDPKGSKL
ncbi:hypothetical protein VTN00DRAFT_6881 [Thermoascus crustaceus]|uniref:uncharacterized protein n=1 Tax=Thermoascus crustaceus TaxID=5088 RepID=UPI0037436907